MRNSIWQVFLIQAARKRNVWIGLLIAGVRSQFFQCIRIKWLPTLIWQLQENLCSFLSFSVVGQFGVLYYTCHAENRCVTTQYNQGNFQFSATLVLWFFLVWNGFQPKTSLHNCALILSQWALSSLMEIVFLGRCLQLLFKSSRSVFPRVVFRSSRNMLPETVLLRFSKDLI